MTRVNVLASGDSPNSDGIHVQQSSDVTILNSNIGNGDDCISIGPGTSSIIGSLRIEDEEDGVYNMTVKSSRFIGTQNGVRIKSWRRSKTLVVRCPCLSVFIVYFDSGVKVSEVIYEDIK
ncbi:polygalacturonase-like [Cucurbita maxima]|uniref:Polygalacturonase-like n=1 Tax=Cucurbita maxima TaxID=3661 RepID=A0A6J1IF43_CUCMA|nr:polygalacturonase-like [Cucurbita maxima]